MCNDTREEGQGRADRLAQFLEMLAQRGIKQRDVAYELNVPTQYLSDLKHGRRTVSEQFARRFAERYRVGAAWLLSGEGSSEPPDLAGVPTSTPGGTRLLPVLSAPDQGDPRGSPHWDGSLAAVTGAAASAVERAMLPFVLRVEADILSGRLRRNDLVLCTQEVRNDAGVVLVRAGGKVLLAQTMVNDQFQDALTGASIEGAEPIGHCLGIVWAPL